MSIANDFCYLILFIWLSAICLNIVFNPVYAALYLIVTFILSAILLYNLGLVLISYIYVIVYVGAIAILFLFIIMFLDLRQLTSGHRLFSFFTLLDILLLIFFFYLFFLTVFSIHTENSVSPFAQEYYFNTFSDFLDQIFFFQYYSFNLSKLLGFFLYAKFVDLLFFVGLFLFVALVVAIYLVNPQKMH